MLELSPFAHKASESQVIWWAWVCACRDTAVILLVSHTCTDTSSDLFRVQDNFLAQERARILDIGYHKTILTHMQLINIILAYIIRLYRSVVGRCLHCGGTLTRWKDYRGLTMEDRRGRHCRMQYRLCHLCHRRTLILTPP